MRRSVEKQHSGKGRVYANVRKESEYVLQEGIGSTGEWEEMTVKWPARVDSVCRHSRR